MITNVLIQAASGQSVQKRAPVVSSKANRAEYLDRAQKSIETLDKMWLSRTATSSTWTGINAWQRFPIADSLMEYIKISGDKTLLPVVELAVANKDGLDGNDDDLWAVISSLKLYDLNKSPSLLQFAQTQYKHLTDAYWDDTCGGGMWWDHERTYKNAITNELLLYAATLLYQATGDRLYYTWSFKEWEWFHRSGLINDRNLVNDGLDKHCSNNGQKTYTYNQGVILGGLINLYLMDKDSGHIATATTIAKAAISDLSNSAGVLVEPAEDLAVDGQIFKGIFVYHLGHLFPHIGNAADRRIISAFIGHNAHSAWNLPKSSGNQINAYWDNLHSLYGAASQAAGIDLFNAAVVTVR
ncbi:putative alpha-1,6-mannanase (GH76 family) [Granulicella aggregans]|uniref:Putative alpha-1,6-mannanase (GH76 family) n=1 Tax=Granulicella aggregans TaxID=474949 RepID=A0A7W7ZFW0_9BACT|nr:putative alpha-1,6-mannanase (GH76 family) [Granulicella aggregans]